VNDIASLRRGLFLGRSAATMNDQASAMLDIASVFAASLDRAS
jgi:hypothetical protein